MIWIIVGLNLPDLRIRADSFDEAIEMAWVLTEEYCGGYVLS